MKGYRTYMDRQGLSPEALARLSALPDAAGSVKRVPSRRPALGALAVCYCLLLVGAGAWRLAAAPPAGEADGPAPTQGAAAPALSADLPAPTQVPETAGKLLRPTAVALDFEDATGDPELAALIKQPDGSFFVELSREEILGLFRSGADTGDTEHPKTDTGGFPARLMDWNGYSLHGRAAYDGNGKLWELDLWGEGEGSSFSLRAAPGGIPLTCVVEPDRYDTQVNGVPVAAWYRAYDGDGDGVAEHTYITQFMAGDVGIRFENTGAPFRSEYGGQTDMDLGGAMEFNALLVTQLLSEGGGIHLDGLLTCDDIPAWREERFETPDQALAEADFAPYLPKTDPAGFSMFEGSLSYQEGVRNRLGVFWYDYDYHRVDVTVYLPEGSTPAPDPVDVNVPESYDWRLYEIPICDNVPEEYQMDFYMPAFRAQDMSLEIVRAREVEADTGGSAYRFWVLHENGAAVSYDCSGLTAEEVWAMVEATLS